MNSIAQVSPADMVPLPRIWRERILGHGRAHGYERIRDGRLPPPIELSPHLRAYTRGEIDAINRARAGGATDDELRALVAKLVAARKQADAQRDAVPA